MRVNVKPDMTTGEAEKGTSWDSRANATSLKHLLKPSLVSMAICGCYSFDGIHFNDPVDNGGKAIYRKLGKIWRIVVLLACIAAFMKGLATFVTLPSTYLWFNIPMFIWYSQHLVMFLISLKSNHVKYGGQRKSFEFWDAEIKPAMNELGLEFPKTKVYRRQSVQLVLATVLAVVNIIGNVLLATDTFSDGLSELFAAPFSPSVFTLFVITLINSIISMIWIYPIFYMMLFANVLTSTFEVFNEFLENHIYQNALKMTCEFQKIRLLQLNLSKLVSELDRDFSYYYATIFVFAIGNSCYILYMILRTTMPILNIVMFLFWLVASLAETTAVFVSAAFVNEAAHGALDSIYYICVNDISSEQLGQLHLFLSKLTGTQIGFTTVGLLTITKEFLLTIAGAFLTYFFLLYTL